MCRLTHSFLCTDISQRSPAPSFATEWWDVAFVTFLKRSWPFRGQRCSAEADACDPHHLGERVFKGRHWLPLSSWGLSAPRHWSSAGRRFLLIRRHEGAGTIRKMSWNFPEHTTITSDWKLKVHICLPPPTPSNTSVAILFIFCKISLKPVDSHKPTKITHHLLV